MHAYLRTLAAACTVAFAITVASAQPASLSVKISGVDKHGRLPDQAAFCPPSSSAERNISPGITWSQGPAGTKSYALLMTDLDVPEDFGRINKRGVVIRHDDPRISVYHWVLVDIPTDIRTLAQGAESEGLVAHGKPVGKTEHGRRGANVYTSFLASNSDMAGTYGGYDGPCPPTNDERIHSYVVQVYALDTASLGLTGTFDGGAVEKAMQGHVLSQGKANATYSLNPHAIADNGQ